MQKIIDKIRSAIKHTIFEDKTYLVGGYVRDFLLKKDSKDLDIVVELPCGGEQLANFLWQKGISSKPVIFSNFGTSFVMIDGNKIEMVMTRKESYRNENRKPDVCPATLIEDIYRRDFTMNAIAISISDGKILDLTTLGLSDLQQKLIRSVQQPEIMFKEDPLRLIRAIRFANQLDFKIEQETAEAIHTCSPHLDTISWERKREELDKMLLSNSPQRAIRMLVEYNLIKSIIPEVSEIINVKQNKYHKHDVFNHSMEVLSRTRPELRLRMSALLHDIGKKRKQTTDEKGIHFYHHEVESSKMAKIILKRLRYSSAFIDDVCFLILNHMRFKTIGEKAEKISPKAIRKIILNSIQRLSDLLELVHADNLSHAKEFTLSEQIPELKKRISALNFNPETCSLPINGDDIKKEFNLGEGKKIGKFLKKAEKYWLKDPEVSKEQLLNKLRNE